MAGSERARPNRRAQNGGLADSRRKDATASRAGSARPRSFSLGAERRGDAQRDFVGERAGECGSRRRARRADWRNPAACGRRRRRWSPRPGRRPSRRSILVSENFAVPITVAALAALICDSTVGVWVFCVTVTVRRYLAVGVEPVPLRLADQIVAEIMADAVLDRRDLDRLQVGDQAGMRGLAVKRLEAAAERQRQRQRGQRRARDQTTTLTILCGTMITFLAGLLSIARRTASRASAAASISAFASASRLDRQFAALAAVDLHRQRHVRRRRSARGRPRATGSARPASRGRATCQHSSARCGIIGAKAWTSMSPASAKA